MGVQYPAVVRRLRRRSRPRLIRSAPQPARLGIPIFSSDFWDPHWKQNSNSIFDSEDVGKFFSNSAVEKLRNRNSDSKIRNSKKNKRRDSILFILRMMSIVIGQLVGLRMSNHMDVLYVWPQFTIRSPDIKIFASLPLRVLTGGSKKLEVPRLMIGICWDTWW